MIHRLENDGLLTRVITNYSTLKEPFWPSQQGIPSNVFLIGRRISLIGSVFNIVLVEMDMCSGAFKGASFRHTTEAMELEFLYCIHDGLPMSGPMLDSGEFAVTDSSCPFSLSRLG